MLFETNGWGLTDENLDLLQGAGLDSYWLDIKAFSCDTYKELCGVSNERILGLPAKILDRGFVLEVLSLYIPGYVGTNQLTRMAELLAEVDPHVPFTLLAFFPAYKLKNNRPPTFLEMLRAYAAVKSTGLKNVKLGNCHVFAKTRREWDYLIAAVGKEAIG